MDYEFPINEATPEPLAIQPKPKTALQPISSDMVDGTFQKKEDAAREKTRQETPPEDEVTPTTRPTAFPAHPVIDQSKLYPTPINHDPVRQAPLPGQTQPQATILTMEVTTETGPNYGAWRIVATIFFIILLVVSLFAAIPAFVVHLQKPDIFSYFSIAIDGLTIVTMIGLLMRKEWARLIIILLCIVGIFGAIPLLIIPSTALNIAIAYTVLRNVLLIGFLMIKPVHIQFN